MHTNEDVALGRIISESTVLLLKIDRRISIKKTTSAPGPDGAFPCGSDMRKPRKGCKERDVSDDRNHTANKDRHFFKVLVGNFHKRLTIPDKFVQQFCGRLAGTVTLEHRGYTFDVEVTNKLGKLVFQEGWKAFVSAHNLKMGDFLVFKYDGFSQFKVLIFDSSCCEKAVPCPMEQNDGERSGEPIEISRTCVESPLKSPEINKKERMHRKGSMLVNISSSSSLSDSSGYFSSSENQKSHAVPRYILPRRTYLTAVQKKKLNEKIRSIHSEIPIYACVMKRSNISGQTQLLNISREYAHAYLLFEEQNLLLHRHGKQWEVRCSFQNRKQGDVRYKRLLKGWKRFAEDNYLHVGDLCLFELVVESMKYTMNVHIIRKK